MSREKHFFFDTIFVDINKDKRYHKEKRIKKGHTKMQNIDDFIESLLVDKGIDVEPDIKEELKNEMKAKLLKEINEAAIRALSEEKAEELAKLVDDPEFTDEKLTEFIQQSGVDLTQITIDTALKFRNFYLGVGA